MHLGEQSYGRKFRCARGALGDSHSKPRAPKEPSVALPKDALKRMLLEHPWLSEEDLKPSLLAAGKHRRRRGARKGRRLHPDDPDGVTGSEDSGSGSDESSAEPELEDSRPFNIKLRALRQTS